MAPTIATKTKAKAKIISAVLFFISVGFRAPDSSSSADEKLFPALARLMELQFDNIVSITTGNLSDERNEEAYE